MGYSFDPDLLKAEKRVAFLKAAREKYPDLTTTELANGQTVYVSVRARRAAADMEFVATAKGEVMVYAYVTVAEGRVYYIDEMKGAAWATLSMAAFKKSHPEAYAGLVRLVVRDG